MSFLAIKVNIPAGVPQRIPRYIYKRLVKTMASVSAVPFMPMLPRLMMHRDWYVFPAWAHPQVRYWGPTWTVIRDCLLGDQEIKDKAEVYLPRMADMDDDEYNRYLDAAVFFNMTARTVNALVGTIFQRLPKLEGVPKKLEEAMAKAIWNGVSLNSFLTNAAEGLIAMGRYGVLVDMPADGGTPFIRGYDCENIVDWQMDWVNGRYVPVQIILREFIEINTRTVGEIRKYKIIYRVLSLDMGGQQLITTPSNTNPTLSEQSVEVVGTHLSVIKTNGGSLPIQASPVVEERADPVYRQYIYTVDNITSPLNTVTPEIVTPTNRGNTLDFIPFMFIGAKDNTTEVDRPPAADIARLNLAHYRAYAHLEHGRYYCAMPIYYVQVMPHSEKAEYILGPSRVWEVAAGEKPGILEFNGQGLKFLESSLQQKEEQIAMIGGRLAGGLARSVSESDNQAQIKESNERALLTKVINNLQDGMAEALKWWAWWQDQPEAKPTVDLNAEFIFDNLGAREIRAAHQMYADGVIPVTVLHQYLQKAGLVPEWMDADEFKSMLDDVDEFPNRPDIWARKLGYQDAAHMHDVRLERRSLRNTEALTELQREKIKVDQTDIEDNIDLDQQQIDLQDEQFRHQKELDKKELAHKQKLDEKKLVLDHKVQMVTAKNPNSTPLPGQVAAARGAASQVKAK